MINQEEQLTLDKLQEPTSVSELVRSLKIVTDVNRVHDLDIPKYLDWGLGGVVIPRKLRAKDVHYMIDMDNNLLRVCWINRALGLLLNGLRADLPREVQIEQIKQCLTAVDLEIGRFVKKDFLNKKHHLGAMSFSQAHEAVAEDAVMISARTFETLCQYHPKWKNVSHVMAVRYPNLGKATTRRLRLHVCDHPPKKVDHHKHTPKVGDIGDLFWLEELRDQLEAGPPGLVDCFYFNPKTLKNSFEGDGDGDLIYLSILDKGKPLFHVVDMVRTPGKVQQDVLDQLRLKSGKTDRPPLVEYLPKYLDRDVLISLATYCIRWKFFLQVISEQPGPDVLHRAWSVVGPTSNDLLEMVMDMHKGDHSEAEILAMVQYLETTGKEIRQAQRDGVWFAKVVTSAQMLDPGEFVKDFPYLHNFADYLQGKPSHNKEQQESFW